MKTKKMLRRYQVAIHPIDLQTLYTQMDKVGRQQGAEQQLASNIREAQQNQNKLEAQKKMTSVQSIEHSNQNSLKINQNGHSSEDQTKQEMKKKDSNPIEEIEKENFIKDPNLGQNIDISG